MYKIVAKQKFKRVVVIDPSHHYYFKGASVALYNSYDTPCGEVPIDLAPIIKDILDEPDTLLVVSSDLSHFHTLKEANIVDNLCIQG
ncbi:MAG TPA: AmmeMemoRadiSam system protein B, partial [Campylobacterales bacterium]|nr:AmmeMemoRadiSam system protein B [Campylobacterales bacterium]